MSVAERIASIFNRWAEGGDLVGGVDGNAIDDLIDEYCHTCGEEVKLPERKNHE